MSKISFKPSIMEETGKALQPVQRTIHRMTYEEAISNTEVNFLINAKLSPSAREKAVEFSLDTIDFHLCGLYSLAILSVFYNF